MAPLELHEDHWAQRDEDRELYEVAAVGVAEHADSMQPWTEAAWVAWQ